MRSPLETVLFGGGLWKSVVSFIAFESGASRKALGLVSVTAAANPAVKAQGTGVAPGGLRFPRSKAVSSYCALLGQTCLW